MTFKIKKVIPNWKGYKIVTQLSKNERNIKRSQNTTKQLRLNKSEKVIIEKILKRSKTSRPIIRLSHEEHVKLAQKIIKLIVQVHPDWSKERVSKEVMDILRPRS